MQSHQRSLIKPKVYTPHGRDLQVSWCRIARKLVERKRKVSEMILVTGGACYIGSHVWVALLDAGLDVVAIDNLCSSNEASLERVQSICGRSLVFRHADIRNEEAISDVIRTCGVTAVIHLAGLKAVGDSNARP